MVLKFKKKYLFSANGSMVPIGIPSIAIWLEIIGNDSMGCSKNVLARKLKPF